MRARLDRYILGSILKVGIIATLICALALVSVHLVSNLENLISHNVTAAQIAQRELLYLPQAVLTGIGPAFLFAITYFLSQLQANNELICLMNAGVPYKRILKPVLILSLAVSVFYFVFNEVVGLDSTLKLNELDAYLLNTSNTYNNRNVTLYDRDNGYVIYIRSYNDAKGTLTATVLIKSNEDGELEWKMNSETASWNADIRQWEFQHNTTYRVSGSSVIVETPEKVVVGDLQFDPMMVRNNSSDMSTMELRAAFSYLNRIRRFDIAQYYSDATDFYQRFLSFLTPLVLMLIACSINYRFKKNVLLFSLVLCICIGVIYYVAQMLTLIMASQGVIAPVFGMLIPFFILIGLSALLRLITAGR